MWKYLTHHETFIKKSLAGEFGDVSMSELKVFHDRQIGFMQHERLIHLIVTMFMAAFWLITLVYVGANPAWPGFVLVILLLVLLGAYLVHYFRMENGIQRLYHLANQIDTKLGVACAIYEGNELKTELAK